MLTAMLRLGTNAQMQPRVHVCMLHGVFHEWHRGNPHLAACVRKPLSGDERIQAGWASKRNERGEAICLDICRSRNDSVQKEAGPGKLARPRPCSH